VSTLLGSIAQQLAGEPTTSVAKDKHGETNLGGRCTRSVMVVGGNQDPVLNPPNRGVTHIASSVFSSLPAPQIRNTHTSSDRDSEKFAWFFESGTFCLGEQSQAQSCSQREQVVGCQA